MFSGYVEILMWAFIVASMTASVGQGFPFNALYFLLVVIYGSLSAEQFAVLCVVHVVLVLYNGLMRGVKP